MIAILGHKGFIGSNFLNYVLKKRIYKKKDLILIDKKDSYILIDDLRYAYTLNVLQTNKVDIVYNFAGESSVDVSIKHPVETFENNYLLILNILEKIRTTKAKLIHISTDEVFGEFGEKYNPSSPYAASKACQDMLIKSYIRTYHVNAQIFRCCNNFGPNQTKDKFIPKVIDLALKNKPIQVWPGRRCWTHVEDTCKELIEFNKTKYTERNQTYTENISNLALAKLIVKLTKSKSNIKMLTFLEVEKIRPGFDYQYTGESSVAKKPFEKSLKETIKWYSQNP